MIPIDYAQALVEEAVFLKLRGEPSMQAEFHRAIDPLYQIQEQTQPDGQLQQLYSRWFVRLGLGSLVSDLLAERPLILENVGKCIIGEAARRREELAELFIRSADAAPGRQDRTLVIRLCPGSLAEPAAVTPLLRRELLHVSDMLAEGFGYDRALPQGPACTQNLIRDRYRVLWDVYVEGRLVREGRVTGDHSEGLRRNFGRVFATQGACPPAEAFQAVFDLESVTHAQLLEWATNPDELPGVCDGSDGTAERPGGPCPLCGFPTYDWYDFSLPGADGAATVISQAKSSWTRGLGACRQCAEFYAADALGTAGASVCGPDLRS